MPSRRPAHPPLGWLPVGLLLLACAAGEANTSNAAGFSSNASQASQGGDSTASAASTDGPTSDTGGLITSSTTLATGGGDADDTGAPAVCGDGRVDGREECDGPDLDGKTCSSLAFAAGALACAPDCTFDTSRCSNPGCGDGVLAAGEECDCGDLPDNCSAAQLASTTCTKLQSPKNTPFTGGVLACNTPDACTFDKSGCIYCGDGVRNASEACEGGDLGGQSCVGLGYTGGALACAADCKFDTGGCVNAPPPAVCGDGTCQPIEDACSCPDDCPDDDPDACSACECGGLSDNCACDIGCLLFGDCCANAPC